MGGRTIKRQGVTLPRIPVLKHHQHLLGKKSRVLCIVKMYRRFIYRLCFHEGGSLVVGGVDRNYYYYPPVQLLDAM